jgi:hypothetical protein
MTRTLKILGLALAVCSLGAVYASGASATTDAFTCGQATCFITGEQVGTAAQNVYGVKGAAVTGHCSSATLKSGAIISGVSSMTLTPSYSGCETAETSSPVDVPASCTFTLSGVTDPFTNTNGAAEGEDATALVNCTGSDVIKVTISGCTVSIGSQSNLKGVKYDDEANTPDDVLATITIDNIAYAASGSLCGVLGFSTPGGSNTFLTERVTFKGYSDVNNGEGSQINLTVS